MFDALLACPGVEEHCELRSSFGVMAFHGGSLERGTDTIARRVAEGTGASFYAVLQPPDLRWHIPSNRVDPAASSALAGFLSHVGVTLALHGYGREGWWTRLLLGGGNRGLAEHLHGVLAGWIEPYGYELISNLQMIPSALRGLHPRNPVNLPACSGVQLELPPRIRGGTPRSSPQHTESLVRGLVEAIVSYGPSPPHPITL